MHAHFVRIILLALAVSGCTDAGTARADETRAQLVGTWLRESESGSVKTRHELALALDGTFVDRWTVSRADAAPEQSQYGGEWSYDGMNLKRRFLNQDGRQFAGGKIRFATFPLASVSQSELVMDDNVQGQRVTYKRVAAAAARKP